MSTVWRVDAHQHFWRFDPAAYGWIGDDMAVLKRDFLPAELRFELDIRHIGGSVAVQARASEAETDFLLGLASSNPWILGEWLGYIVISTQSESLYHKVTTSLSSQQDNRQP